MQLRKRQQQFVDRTVEALGDFGNTLGIAPTGAGKTVMMAATTQAAPFRDGRKLVLQHRAELVDQNHRTLSLVAPREVITRFTAEEKRWGGQTVFAMVQTLGGDQNLASIPDDLSIVAIDEAHHAAAATYRKIINTVLERNPDAKILGVTATPERGDRKALSSVFTNISDIITLQELVAAGHLVRPRAYSISTGLETQIRETIREIEDHHGSVRETDMHRFAAILDTDEVAERIVAEYTEKAAGRQAVAFCTTVAHADRVAAAFRSAGIEAATVHGNMSARAREDVLAAYDSGEIQVLTNCMVLTEGFDHQPTSAVIICRPCPHKSLLQQMIGRGLRKVDPERYPGVHKTDCVLMDFGLALGTYGSLTLVSGKNLELQADKNCVEETCQKRIPFDADICLFCGAKQPQEGVEREEREEGEGEGDGEERAVIVPQIPLTEINIFDDSPFKYVEMFDGIVLLASAFDAWAAVIAYQGLWYAVGQRKGDTVKVIAENGEKIMSLASADDFLREHGDATAAHKSRGWVNMPATFKQQQLLERRGFPGGAGLNRYQASCALEWVFNERQIRQRLQQVTRAAA